MYYCCVRGCKYSNANTIRHKFPTDRETRDLQDSLSEAFFELTVDVNLHQFTSSTEFHKSGKEIGEQVLHTACRFGKVGAIKKLIQNGASVDIKTCKGLTPLMHASESGHINAVKYLIHANASINLQNNSGETALILSSWRGHKAVVEYLCSKKADVHITAKFNYTALDVADKEDKEEIIKTLKKYGA